MGHLGVSNNCLLNVYYVYEMKYISFLQMKLLKHSHFTLLA